jgi:hypothetical protein
MLAPGPTQVNETGNLAAPPEGLWDGVFFFLVRPLSRRGLPAATGPLGARQDGGARARTTRTGCAATPIEDGGVEPPFEHGPGGSR